MYPGTSMADLLAAPNEDDRDNLKLVQTWFQNVFNAASAPSPDGIVIHCSDAHLKPTDLANRKYMDTERGNMLVTAPRRAGITPTDNACGGFIKAFTYARPGQQVLLLCSDSVQGALKSGYMTQLGQWRTGGNLRDQDKVKEKGLDFLGMYLSTTILHELMHAASFVEQAKALQPAQFPAILPEKSTSNLYQYTPISGKKIGDQTSSGQSTANNLQHNADSYSLLAASWYLPLYAWVNGECKIIGEPRRAPAEYPNTPIPPGPS